MIIDWTSGEYYQPHTYFGLGVIITWVSEESVIAAIIEKPEGWVLGLWFLGWKDVGMPSNTGVKFDMPEREALFDMPKYTVPFDMPIREVEIEI